MQTLAPCFTGSLARCFTGSLARCFISRQQLMPRCLHVAQQPARGSAEGETHETAVASLDTCRALFPPLGNALGLSLW
jgi:hypothetical protein